MFISASPMVAAIVVATESKAKQQYASMQVLNPVQ